METERAGKAQVSGVISGLSFGAVFTFSQRQLPTLLRLHINTRFPQRSGGRHAIHSTLTGLKAKGEIRPAALSVYGTKQMWRSCANHQKKCDADILVWAAEIVINSNNFHHRQYFCKTLSEFFILFFLNKSFHKIFHNFHKELFNWTYKKTHFPFRCVFFFFLIKLHLC